MLFYKGNSVTMCFKCYYVHLNEKHQEQFQP